MSQNEEEERKIIIRDAVVIYSSLWEAIELLNSEKERYIALKNIIDYGIYGIEPNVKSKRIKGIIIQALPVINKAYSRHVKAVSQGKYGASGGRPESISIDNVIELQRKGYTISQIAEELECSISTVYKKLEKLKTLNSNVNKKYNTNYNTNVNVANINVYDKDKIKYDNKEEYNYKKIKTLGEKMNSLDSLLDE